jgi:hypothetical protein
MRLCAAAIVLGALALRAQSAASGSVPAYDSFRIVSQRNIFDPNRSGMRTHITTRNHSHVDVVSLVGTMSYSKGKFAFFDGNSSQYRKVLQPGGVVAGYTIKDITTNAVTLALNGKELEMNIGSQLRNEGQSGWQLTVESDIPPSLDSYNGGSSVSLTPPVGSSPEMSEVLKRLAQQREQVEQAIK